MGFDRSSQANTRDFGFFQKIRALDWPQFDLIQAASYKWGSRGRWFKSSHSDQNAEIVDDFSVFFIGYNIPVLVYFLLVLIFYTSSGIFQKNHLTFLPERV